MLDSEYELISFALYSVLKGGANLLDLVLEPKFYDNWDGSGGQIDQHFQKSCENQQMKETYIQARRDQVAVRSGKNLTFKAAEWRDNALRFLEAALEMSYSMKNS